jgi:hypothetical protein
MEGFSSFRYDKRAATYSSSKEVINCNGIQEEYLSDLKDTIRMLHETSRINNLPTLLVGHSIATAV